MMQLHSVEQKIGLVNLQSAQPVMCQRASARSTHSVPEIVFNSGQSLTFTTTAGEGRASISERLCYLSNKKGKR